ASFENDSSDLSSTPSGPLLRSLSEYPDWEPPCARKEVFPAHVWSSSRTRLTPEVVACPSASRTSRSQESKCRSAHPEVSPGTAQGSCRAGFRRPRLYE